MHYAASDFPHHVEKILNVFCSILKLCWCKAISQGLISKSWWPKIQNNTVAASEKNQSSLTSCSWSSKNTTSGGISTAGGGPQLRPGRNASGRHSEHRNFENHAVCSRLGGMHKQVCARTHCTNAIQIATRTSEWTFHLQVNFCLLWVVIPALTAL